MGKILEPNLFTAVYHAMSRRIKNGTAPTLMIFPGSGLVRAVDSKYLKNPKTGAYDPSRVPSNLIPRDSASDHNRWSGVDPQGMRSIRGGLYTSTNTAPMMNEVMHYAPSPSTKAPKALAPFSPKTHLTATSNSTPYYTSLLPKAIIRLRITQSLLIVDLSRYSSRTTNFLKALEQDKDVRLALEHSHYAGAALERAIFDGFDYSAARGIGNAVASDLRMDGIQAGTARQSDRDGETGDNMTLYGPDGHPIKNVVAEEVISFDRDNSDPIRHKV